MADITVTIPNAKLADFKDGFLRMRPVPLDGSGTPIMTENAWIKECVRVDLFETYRNGKKQLAQDALSPTIDEGVVT